MLWIIAGIWVFLILVVLQELGHFLAAKWSGVKVLEFGVGIPPKIGTYHTDHTGTEYTINAIPLWWFVRLKGEDPKVSSDFYASDSFISASLIRKILILIGGVTVNFLIAYLGFVLVFWHGVSPIQILPEWAISWSTQSYLFPTRDRAQEFGLISGDLQTLDAQISIVMTGGLANQIGLMSGDIITQINQKKVNSLNLSRTLKQFIDSPLTIDYIRDGKTRSATGTCPTDQCLLGVMISQSGALQILPYQFSFGQAWVVAWQEIVAETKLTLSSIKSLFVSLISGTSTERSQSLSKISWPVWAVKVGNTILQYNGIWWYLAFACMISLALAIFNILPIPALDGGRIVWVLIQSAFRLKPESYFIIENYLNILFFVLMMGLGIYIIGLDLVRFRGVTIPGIG